MYELVIRIENGAYFNHPFERLEVIREFALVKEVGRMVVNSPTACVATELCHICLLFDTRW